MCRCNDKKLVFFCLQFFLASVLTFFCILIIDVDAEPYVVQSAREVKKPIIFVFIRLTLQRDVTFLQNDKLGKSLNTKKFFR